MIKNLTTLLVGFILLFLSSCKEDIEEVIIQDSTPYILLYGGLPDPTLPDDNVLTVQGVKLGKMLFYETLLSKGESQSCASCHLQKDGFSDLSQFSEGVEGLLGKRQAMPIFNMAWHSNEFFWDGRANLLRDQALLPIQDPLEMNETLENVVDKLSSEKMYRDQFTRVYGNEEITPDKIALALEQFMLSIVSYQSKYDQYLAGNVDLTESEARGETLFFTEFNPFFPEFSGADCAHCHGGLNFENDLYMNNGLDEEANILDIGRMKVTELSEDKGKFKVPSLRNIELTGPYMHDGRFTTLEEVVEHYNSGLHPSSTLDLALESTRETGLGLSEEDKTDLVNFLKTLTDYAYIENEEYADPIR